jgi:hypothetical protein
VTEGPGDQCFNVILPRGVVAHTVNDIGILLSRSNHFEGFKMEEVWQNLPAALTQPPCDVESIIALGEKEYVVDFLGDHHMDQVWGAVTPPAPK